MGTSPSIQRPLRSAKRSKWIRWTSGHCGRLHFSWLLGWASAHRTSFRSRHNLGQGDGGPRPTLPGLPRAIAAIRVIRHLESRSRDAFSVSLDPKSTSADAFNVSTDASNVVADEKASRATIELVPETEATKVTVTHDEWAEDYATYTACADGWPRILSRLKTLLETGKTFKPH